MTLAAATVLAASSWVAGCSALAPIAAVSSDKLVPGTTYSADLDGDGLPEQIMIDAATGSLTITDGDVEYQSRDRWRVVEAGLGDTDHDGLLEVVTLLDDEEGRHLGLFAYFGGAYRERLVTSELSPRPLSLEVVSDDQALGDTGSGGDTGGMDAGTGESAADGDLIVITVEPASGQSEPQTVLCRWNGFGFTGIEPSASQ